MLQKATLISLLAVILLLYLTQQVHPIYAVLRQGVAESINERGVKFLHDGRPEDAIGAFDWAIKFAPDEGEYYFNLAMALDDYHDAAHAATGYGEDAKLYAEITRLLKKARTLDPADYCIAERYASNFLFADRFGEQIDLDEATAAYMYCLQLATGSTDPYPDTVSWESQAILLDIAHLEMSNGNLESAEKYLSLVMKTNPNSRRGQILSNILEKQNFAQQFLAF